MMGWDPPTIVAKWGPYFKPSAQDDQLLVTSVTAAVDAGLATKRMALQKLQRVFGIESVDQALEALEAEAEENHRRAMATMHAAGTENPDDDGEKAGNGPSGGSDAGAGPNAPGTGGGRGRSLRGAAKAPGFGRSG